MILPHIALARFFTRALDYNKRATRAEYWWVQLIFVVATLGLVAALAMGVLPIGLLFDPLTQRPTDTAQLIGMIATACWMPNVMLTARRLHDAGRSGLWFLFCLVPLIGPIWVTVLLCLPSQEEANKWGLPEGTRLRPLRETADPVAAAPQGNIVARRPTRSRHGALEGYATLVNANIPPSAEMLAARKAEVSDYYRRNVLKQVDIPAE